MTVPATSGADPAEPPADGNHLAESLRSAMPVVAVYAATRAVTLAAAWVVTLIRVDPSAADPATRPHTISQVLAIWDGHWYIDVALNGYPHVVPAGNFSEGTGAAAQNGIAFFPGYPLLIRWVHLISPFSVDIDAVAIAMVAGLIATLAIWATVRDRTGDETANRAAMAFCCFPAAFILSFAYTESLMLAAAALSLWAATRKRWVWAGLAAAVATFTRSTGMVLVPALGVAALMEIHRRRQWRALVAPLLAPLGMIGFLTYLRFHTGSWTIWFEAEHRGWGHRLDFGAAAARNTWRFVTHPMHDPQLTLLGFGTIVAIAGLVAIWRTRQPIVVTLYAVAMLGSLLLSPDLQIRPRFVLGAFPLITALGEWIPRRWFAALIAASVGGLGVLTILFGLRLTEPQVLFP